MNDDQKSAFAAVKDEVYRLLLCAFCYESKIDGPASNNTSHIKYLLTLRALLLHRRIEQIDSS